jgi:DNA-binding LytR/AlgR family response regulator
MKISCVIVDDVQLNRDIMSDLIAGVAFLNLAGTFSDANEAMNALNELEPDVMFLDIEMPGMSGLSFLKSLPSPPVTLLTTSHKEFATEGFEMNVFDYLVKPITRERFAVSVSRLYRYFKTRKRPLLADQIFIKTGGKYIRVKLSEILYIEAMRDFVIVYTDKAKYVTLENLKEFSSHLPDDQFLRIHRSYVAPIRKIEMIDGNTVLIQNRQVPIGESYRHAVMRLLLGKED